MYLNYINNFRGLAIIYIVAGHCIETFDWQYSEQFERLLKIVLKNGTVFFVFIAGYLFQYLMRKYQTKTYLIAKIKYVLLPYIIISIPSIIYFFVQSEEFSIINIGDKTLWAQIFYFYFTGTHLPHLWFIPMIFHFYLISPVLVALDKNKWFYGILPLTIIISCIYDRDNISHNFTFIHFFSPYLLGMFFSHYREKINIFLINYANLAVLIFIYLVLINVEFYLMNDKTMTFVNFLHKLLLCAVFMGLLINLEGKFNAKLLTILAQTSFGIFFIHPYFISTIGALETKVYGNILQGNLLSYSLFVTLILSLSCTTVLMFKKILGSNSRLILGS